MLASWLLAVTAFVGARVLPVEGAPIERGVLVVDGARIVAGGPEGSTSIPAGATRVDLSGKTLIPGLVDTHSNVGGVAGADGSAPIQPDVSVGDSVTAG